jgi:hypothetical protein
MDNTSDIINSCHIEADSQASKTTSELETVDDDGGRTTLRPCAHKFIMALASAWNLVENHKTKAPDQSPIGAGKKRRRGIQAYERELSNDYKPL